jgi:hypothetical protein
MHNFVPPTFKLTAFNCPHCNAYANQKFYQLYLNSKSIDRLNISYCSCCYKYSLWLGTEMIFPSILTIQLPNQEMPNDVQQDYLEAREIFNKSPRAAAALLRLGLQKLMVHLGEKGANINDDIASLVKNGLPVRIQQALDSVRVIGNNAVHPGEINLNDNPSIAQSLFSLLNIIVDVMIAQPKQIEALYGQLPDKAISAIEKRDK